MATNFDDSEWEAAQLQEMQQQITAAIEKSVEAHRQLMYQRKRHIRNMGNGVTIAGGHKG